jgi:hypothetical protein
VIVKEDVVPAHVAPPFEYVGVTTRVAVRGEVPVFFAAKEEIVPLPADARPMDVLLFVQSKTVPLTPPEKEIAFMVVPLQTVWLDIEVTVGVGLIVMVKVDAVPVHDTPLFEKVGVTVIVDVTAVFPVFLAVKEAMLPVPLLPKPMDELVFVQE